MGKSPAKWIKSALFGKKSSKSNLSKDATLDKKISTTVNEPSMDSGADKMVISSPVPAVTDASGGHAELEKSSSANLTGDTVEVVRSTMGLNTATGHELIRLEQAATKAQAAFRGYLARRAFWALKGIIRLQALVRGHLVRRQAVVTLSCMRAIVEFQALVRGRRARLVGNGSQVLQKYNQGQLVDKKRADLLGTSLRLEKLSTNAFVTKLVTSLHTTKPLSIHFDPVEPNSVRNWLERWSYSHFWEPLPLPKKTVDAKPKRKQTKLQAEVTETGRPKRSVRRVPAANLDGNLLNTSENEKPKRTVRKVVTHQAEPVQEQSHSELEKVKRNLRKISLSAAAASEKPEVLTEKLVASLDKVSCSLNPDVPGQGTDQPFDKVNDSNVVAAEQPELEAVPVPVPPLEHNPLDPLPDDHPPVVPPSEETNGKFEPEPPLSVELNGKEHHSSKENQKTRRRKSFPVKQEYPESVSQTAPALPSYMAATESAKAKLRAQAAAKAAEDGAENGFLRRHSLPSSTGKLSLQSPRIQKPLQANGKGWSKSNKAQISPRDDKVLQAGWKR